MAALPHDSARPFNRKIGFVYANYFANHFHNAAFHPSYFLDQLVQSHKMKNPQPVDRLKLQIPESPLRAHFVKTRVKVRQYPDGTHAIFYGPRCLGRYDKKGVLNEERKAA